MRRQDFDYELPEHLIAKQPTDQRSEARLLELDGKTGHHQDKLFVDLLDIVTDKDLMVFNDTKVIPARIFGQKSSGGKVEILVERVIDHANVLAYVRSSRSPKAQSEILLENGVTIEVTGREADLFALRFQDSRGALAVLEDIGHMPLPPYIDRADTVEDRSRYQTIYGRHAGAVAAPTAGLHFDEAMMARLEAKGVQKAFVTLHVGAGTFSPVRVDNITEHKMHSEWMTVSADVAEQVKQTKSNGGRVIAVGTTSVRSLESAAQHSADGSVAAYEGETNIFIYPSYQFKVVDAMVTNFHMPESTLMMLVSAFAGYDNIMRAYRHAVTQSYRFFSYGDATFLHRQADSSAG